MEIELVKMTCGNCGILYYIEKGWYDILVADKKDFYCPKGHGKVFTGKTKEEKIKEVERKATENFKYYEEQLEENEKLRKDISNHKGQITKLKNKYEPKKKQKKKLKVKKKK